MTLITLQSIRLTVVACACCLTLPAYAGNVCKVKSGAATAALVELYTSEGCSSCPPADLQLRQLKQVLDAGAVVVPLALHVSYWDRIGWKDVFAQPQFDARQSALLTGRASRIVYTPQFFVNGDELRSWRNDLPATVRRVNARAAPVTITLTSAPNGSDGVALEADVVAADPQLSGALYLAVSESALVSQVTRGENSGTTLRHDNTVRKWFGPIALKQGRAQLQQQIALPADWHRENLQAVAFVQNQDGVLQALSTAQCQPARGL
ncbi:DUF1223 domain-containing protein [Actimicrobium sp. CCC2.4]|uniref:DUF1223 domain-containing protein n=1 Tax=Actimicrobium sp. CCC2.4 TaxID=3048606 RepID=UPI002AC9BDE3|nr:DUF1223 domain-containing protein [Actimicrobium sp. CCC2.4]MEB0136216.1 DUF1223 domain-containing protein [Actimicrobium sp. CCC2.4]WPX33562.1 DUF1223 domain-containing protein [Actimicrobium sp. CCC2.4]